MTTRPLILQIPPLPAYVGTARLFAAAVARQMGVDEDAIDDLKVVVSEACTEAIRVRESSSDETDLRILMTPEGQTLRLEVEKALDEELSPGDSTTDNITRNLGSELIRALYPDAEVVGEQNELASVRISIPLP